ncbi:MAG: glycyl-radical enzyme activating protein [bacterium]|nr:glycyl-radical enzyme activating protein [bacterium]
MSIKIFDIAFCSLYDGPGPRVVVYFQGCNARCVWCHSPHLQPAVAPLLFFPGRCLYCGRCERACEQDVHKVSASAHRLNRKNCRRCGQCVEACPVSFPRESGGALLLPDSEYSADELFQKILTHLEIVRGNGGITLSGGEALLQQDGARKLLKLCKTNGFHTAVETSGLLPDKFYANVENLVDAWLFGMRFTTGIQDENYEDVIDNSFGLIKKMRPKEILPRIPVIPGYTDSNRYLEQCRRLLEKYHHRHVFLNPWNKNTNHYYTANGITPMLEPVTPAAAKSCQEKIYRYFVLRDIKPLDMNPVSHESREQGG